MQIPHFNGGPQPTNMPHDTPNVHFVQSSFDRTPPAQSPMNALSMPAPYAPPGHNEQMMGQRVGPETLYINATTNNHYHINRNKNANNGEGGIIAAESSHCTTQKASKHKKSSPVHRHNRGRNGSGRQHKTDTPYTSAECSNMMIPSPLSTTPHRSGAPVSGMPMPYHMQMPMQMPMCTCRPPNGCPPVPFMGHMPPPYHPHGLPPIPHPH